MNSESPISCIFAHIKYMNMKKKDVASVYNTLKNVALGGLSKEDKMAVIKMMVAFKKVVDSYNEQTEMIREKLLTPEVQEALKYMEKHKDDPVNGENATTVMEYAKTINKANEDYAFMANELNNEEFTDFKPLSEETITQIIDNNDIKVEEGMLLLESVVEK